MKTTIPMLDGEVWRGIDPAGSDVIAVAPFDGGLTAWFWDADEHRWYRFLAASDKARVLGMMRR